MTEFTATGFSVVDDAGFLNLVVMTGGGTASAFVDSFYGQAKQDKDRMPTPGGLSTGSPKAGEQTTIITGITNPNATRFENIRKSSTFTVTSVPEGVDKGSVTIKKDDKDVSTITFPDKEGIYVFEVTIEVTVFDKEADDGRGGKGADVKPPKPFTYTFGIPVSGDDDRDGNPNVFERWIEANFALIRKAAETVPELAALLSDFESIREDGGRDRIKFKDTSTGSPGGGPKAAETTGGRQGAKYGPVTITLSPPGLSSEDMKLETMLHEIRHAQQRKEINDALDKGKKLSEVDSDGDGLIDTKDPDKTKGSNDAEKDAHDFGKKNKDTVKNPPPKKDK